MSTVKRKSKQLGQILIELGYITPEQLEVALEEHRKTPKSLGRVLIDLGMIHESDLVRALAEQVGLEFVDLAEFQIDPIATVAASRGPCPPVPGAPDRRARRAAARRDVRPRERLRARRHPHHHRPRRAAGRGDRQRRRGSDPEVRQHGLPGRGDGEHRREPPTRTRTPISRSRVEDAPIVKLVNAIMTQAVGDRASDVHIEPARRTCAIRFRVDGVLHRAHAPRRRTSRTGSSAG